MSVKRNFKGRRRLVVLIVVLVFIGGLIFDLSRQPENQLTARVYIGFVHGYQAVGRPLLDGVVACRFRPTCSDYSIESVRRYGTLRGLALTFHRLNSCADNVPMGTIDEVPS
jgi:putative component of membrane protein insertase Oxa1/YidC/SpoIIIJ protein YidD